MTRALLFATLVGAPALACGGPPVPHVVLGKVVKKELPCAPAGVQPSYDADHAMAPAPGERFIVRRGKRSDPADPLEPYGPVVAEFRSRDEGRFSVDLTKGTYCVSRARDLSRCFREWSVPEPDAKKPHQMEVSEACPEDQPPGPPE